MTFFTLSISCNFVFYLFWTGTLHYYVTLTLQHVVYICNVFYSYLDCGSLSVFNGYLNTSETYYNTVVSITCYYGYRHESESTTRCQANGEWTSSDMCEIVGRCILQ